MLTLARGQVDVWLARPVDGGQVADMWHVEALLDAEERAQLHRFVFARDRDLYLAAHIALRTRLSLYAETPPASWRFVKNRYGRPEIACSSGASRLRFNLSHTRGLAAVAITLADDVGVDVENTRWREPPLEIADHYFAPAEVTELHARSLIDQRERFFDYWTLKEAYIKARGMGLALPLDKFAFQLVADGEPRITFDAALHDDPCAWQFALRRIGGCHRLALALRCKRPLRIQVRDVCWQRIYEADPSN